MYTHTIHLRTGVPIAIVSNGLPIYDDGLLFLERQNGERVTFVVDAVAYFTTRQGV